MTRYTKLSNANRKATTAANLDHDDGNSARAPANRRPDATSARIDSRDLVARNPLRLVRQHDDVAAFVKIVRQIAAISEPFGVDSYELVASKLADDEIRRQVFLVRNDENHRSGSSSRSRWFSVFVRSISQAF